MTEMLDVGNVDAFAEKLHGSVTRPGDPDYDEVRALYNAMIDKRPALIARCADRDDVVAAVNFGREQGLDIAIRCGGHNGPGCPVPSTCPASRRSPSTRMRELPRSGVAACSETSMRRRTSTASQHREGSSRRPARAG